jgi:hypothetical protein
MLSFLPSCYSSYGAWTLTPVGLAPTDHASLRWTHRLPVRIRRLNGYFPEVWYATDRFPSRARRRIICRRREPCIAATAITRSGLDFLSADDHRARKPGRRRKTQLLASHLRLGVCRPEIQGPARILIECSPTTPPIPCYEKRKAVRLTRSPLRGIHSANGSHEHWPART